jgi:DNA mismatch endonuclease (patch repair protein)
MSRIRGADTKLELSVRHALHGQGLRYRLGGSGLPGRPDLVFPRHETVLFVHGCFWHGHACHLFRLPKTRPEFWGAKIDGNRARDKRVEKELRSLGWRPLVLWECELRGKTEPERSSRLRKLAKEIRKRMRHQD